MDYVETCVIGAGVIGLAIAARLAAVSEQLLIIEAQSRFGQGISSRNSEVIHAGIYYEPHSLKAELCRQGKHRLYSYCEANGIPHRRTGKLIVATSAEEEQTLDAIRSKAMENGVDDLVFWSEREISSAEPMIRARLGLYSPSTGIVSSHDLMSTYLAEAEAEGATFASQCRVTRIEHKAGRFELSLATGDSTDYRIACRNLINAAGLGAQAIASTLEGRLDKVPPLHLCKGNYFVLKGPSPFSHLIYPVPEPSGAGLGVHATLDLAGQVRFGPDVEYLEEEDYSVSLTRLPGYYRAIRRYYPALKDHSLEPAYAGIRPKIQAQGEPVMDFLIHGHQAHGIENLVELFGIESPGLTASAAIADYVEQLLR